MLSVFMSYVTPMVPHTLYGTGIIWSPTRIYGPPHTLYGIGMLWSPLTLFGTCILWSPMYDMIFSGQLIWSPHMYVWSPHMYDMIFQASFKRVHCVT